ncbi:hypothetical protein IV203_029757 [Nitzschia inconspicua]|uniref:Transmembrane protein n=1 Tax=Nitzschia inconspicua TaxID=303405 RepID=A0A9K3K7L1_9STRA|nr:hypothetical protein IV203_004839 [Nitzschia inconspicua]KAG7367087.1 hypothetical protein IV203_029757 [Nitzschia inconspicua]
MTVLAETNTIASQASILESSPDLVPADENFCDTNSAIEKGETSKVDKPTKILTDDEEEDEYDHETTINGNGSLWVLLLTFYFPVMMVWIRRSMFGSVHLIRTLIVGQLLRLAFLENVAEWIMEKAPSCLRALLDQTEAVVPKTIIGPLASPSTAKCYHATTAAVVDPYAWPPPAFTALALLTVVTLVIHPDGLTWIILGKLRDAMYAAVSTFVQCWELFMYDYGLIPTVVAATTLACLVFLVFVVFRTLSPKPKPLVNSQTERKKKKKKGNSRRREYQQQRHGTAVSSAPSTTLLPDSRQHDSPHESKTDANNRRKSTFDCRVDSGTPKSESKSSPDSNPLTSDLDSSSPFLTTAERSNLATTTLHCPKDGDLSKAERCRISSSSTVETIAMLDDQSYETASVRSYPSVSASSTRSGENVKNSKVSTPHRRKRKGGRHPNTPDRISSGSQRINTKVAVAAPYVPSRWDALKPEQSTGNPSGIHAKASNHQQETPPQHAHNKPRRNGNANLEKNNLRARHAPSTVKNAATSTSITRKSRWNKSAARTPKISPNAATNVASSGPAVVTSESSSLVLGVPLPGIQRDLTRHCSEFSGSSHWEGLQSVSSDDLGVAPPKDRDVVSSLLYSRLPKTECDDWTMGSVNRSLIPSTDSVAATHVPFGGNLSTKVHDNPFAVNNMQGYSNSYQADLDSQIEADLQELGGQMAGSILDF